MRLSMGCVCVESVPSVVDLFRTATPADMPISDSLNFHFYGQPGVDACLSCRFSKSNCNSCCGTVMAPWLLCPRGNMTLYDAIDGSGLGTDSVGEVCDEQCGAALRRHGLQSIAYHWLGKSTSTRWTAPEEGTTTSHPHGDPEPDHTGGEDDEACAAATATLGMRESVVIGVYSFVSSVWVSVRAMYTPLDNA